jgi:hypothetical protein
MLGLPTAAFAGHHEGHFRSYGWHGRGGHWGEHWGGRPGWHDRGWHNGWFRHGDDDEDGGWRYGGRPEWNENRGGWRNPGYGYGYGCGDDGDDCGRGGFWNRFNGADDDGYFPGGGYNPNQLNSLLARRQQAAIELRRMRAQGDSRAAGRMANILQGLNGRIARDRGGYGYAAPMAPLTSYPGGYNGYGGYPYGNTEGAVGALMGPLLGIR